MQQNTKRLPENLLGALRVSMGADHELDETFDGMVDALTPLAVFRKLAATEYGSEAEGNKILGWLKHAFDVDITSTSINPRPTPENDGTTPTKS